jgi:pimeloyl-ACP methyl ester carboxylesterase
MKCLYKSKESKAIISQLYFEKLNSLEMDSMQMDIQTSFGNTRVVQAGNKHGKKLVLFHGINAGSPVALEAVKELHKTYHLIGIDTIGQATQSDENRINIYDESYAKWAVEVLDKLEITEANFIGISYGAYILQKLLCYKPEVVSKCIFVVPGGLVNGKFWPTLIKLTLPLVRFQLSKSDEHLKKFISSFIPTDDEFMFRLQKAIFTHVELDYRRPALLKKRDVAHVSTPVYMIVADTDVFFPGLDSVNRAKLLFSNFKESYVLSQCVHMPSKQHYSEIQQKIKEWIS